MPKCDTTQQLVVERRYTVLCSNTCYIYNIVLGKRIIVVWTMSYVTDSGKLRNMAVCILGRI